jgi:bifunctional DNA primase/polymerase-like protein
MVEAVLRGRRRRTNERMVLAASSYAAMGWPVCLGAQPRERPARDRQQPPRVPQQGNGQDRACSCDRVGCPAPGAHPLSPAWKLQASTDVAVVGHWWQDQPHANVLLVTGRSFDVLDVPVAAGLLALRLLAHAKIAAGPVAVSASDRALFFVTTRAAQGDEDEWWSCHLDCEPEVLPEVAGLRWHCRDSYVVAPPSRLSSGMAARWLTEPTTQPLPDALRLLEVLADACEEIAQ